MFSIITITCNVYCGRGSYPKTKKNRFAQRQQEDKQLQNAENRRIQKERSQIKIAQEIAQKNLQQACNKYVDIKLTQICAGFVHRRNQSRYRRYFYNIDPEINLMHSIRDAIHDGISLTTIRSILSEKLCDEEIEQLLNEISLDIQLHNLGL